MGWQNKDWVKHDDELAKLYGVTPRRTRTLRIGVWSVIAVLILTVGGFAYTQRTTAVSFATTPQPDLLFGLRGTNQGVPSDYPGGTGTACNEEEFTAATGHWTCVSWAVDIRNLPIVQPPEQLPPPVAGLSA